MFNIAYSKLVTVELVRYNSAQKKLFTLIFSNYVNLFIFMNTD